MKTKIAAIATIMLMGTIIPYASAEQIPSWVKNNAGWWADGTISESEFLRGIQFLIKEEIIIIPPTSVEEQKSQNVPEWVKSNAGWWANGDIDDNSFVQGIQFLIKTGLVSIPQENPGQETASEDSEVTDLQTQLEKCQEIKKAYDRLNCEKDIKHKLEILEYKRTSEIYTVGPSKFYFPGAKLEITDSGAAFLTIDMLVENTGDKNLELMCSGPAVCNYDVWNGQSAFKYSSTDFTSGLLVIKPGESKTFSIFFGPNIGYGGTEFIYDPTKDYVFRISEPWGSASIPLNLK
jgi:hypothetical protein